MGTPCFPKYYTSTKSNTVFAFVYQRKDQILLFIDYLAQYSGVYGL